MNRTRRAFRRWVEETWGRFAAYWLVQQLNAMWPLVQAAMSSPVPCRSCAAPLERSSPRGSETITCPFCRAVNQLVTDPLVDSYYRAARWLKEERIVERKAALAKLNDDWEDYRDAEYAAGRERPDEPLERLRQREQLEKEYWTLYYEARWKTQGGTDADVQSSVAEEMKRGFYAEMEKTDAWRLAHGQPSIAEADAIPSHLKNVDEWGPLDPKTHPNAAEDDQVHEFLLRDTAGDPERREALLQWLGYRDELQRRMTHETFRHYYDPHWFTPEGRASMQRASQRASVDAVAFARWQAPPELEPIEGVPIELYGQLEAYRARETPEEFLNTLARHELDHAKLHRIAKAWGERMSRDRSNTIYTEYQKAFFAEQPGGAAAADAFAKLMGQVPLSDASASGAPMSFERFCEVQGAMMAWSKLGRAADTSLTARFRITEAELSAIAMYWSQKITEDPELVVRFSWLVAQHESAYLARG
jgi:LSD1 subclass zinc finger protein